MTHHVYRLFDAAGVCLYVGATGDLTTRVGHHRRRAWGDQIAVVDATEHEDRGTAEYVETDEIQRLKPIHNVRGIPQPAPRPNALQDVIYGFVVDHGPIDQRDCQRLLNATGYTGHTDSAVANTLKRLLERGVVAVAGRRPARSGHYRTARLYAAGPEHQAFYLAWYGDWRVAA